MFLLRLFAAITSVFAQDPVGSTGCSAPACVFSNPRLRFGTGTENSVNAWGLFVQPWYFSPTASTWYKLTYSNYPLDTAVGTGTGSPHWSGTNIVNLYGLTPLNALTDYSNFIVDTSDTTKSVGHGKIVATRSFVLSGQNIAFQNTFSLGWNDSFVKIVTRVINNSTTPLVNMIMWTGTRDDYVGLTDVNTKTRGNLDTGSFVGVTMNNQSSRAIMITNTNEGVLFYSETPGVMTSYALCCSFSNAYDVYPLSLAPATPNPTDGSYAAVLPVGNISVGLSGSITWYYAAGAISSLSTVAQTVAAAQVADAGTPTATVTPAATVTSTPSVTPSGTSIATTTGTPSITTSGTPPTTGTRTPSVTGTPPTTITAISTTTPQPVPNHIIAADNTPLVIDIIIINVVSVIILSCCLTCILCIAYLRIYNKRCSYCKERLVNETLEEHMHRCDAYVRRTPTHSGGVQLRNIAF